MSSLRPFVRRHRFSTFVVLTFVLTWLPWLTVAWMLRTGRPPVVTILVLVGGFGPFFAAVPVAASADVGDLLFESSLTGILGVTGALRDTGWTPGLMGELDVLLAAPETPGLAPERIFPVGGLVDEMTQYPTMRDTLDRWGVPEANRLEWDCGHFGVTLRAMRTGEFQEFARGALASPA